MYEVLKIDDTYLIINKSDTIIAIDILENAKDDDDAIDTLVSNLDADIVDCIDYYNL